MSNAAPILSPLAFAGSSPSLRKWLWRLGVGVWLFIATLLAAGPFLSPEKEPAWRTFGFDCFVSYAAGTLASEGRWAELHDVRAFQRVQRELAERWKLEIAESPAPWLNPPFYALAWIPLAKLPYPAAWATWLAISFVSLIVSCRLLTRMATPRPTWSDRALIFILVTASMPALIALGCGQNSCLSLLILSLAVTFWRAGRALAAGLTLGLMAYKPQLGAVVGLMLAASLGWRAVLGMAATGIVLLCAALLAAPGALPIYLESMPRTIAFMQTSGHFPWARHVTFHAFWHVLLADRFSSGAPVARLLGWLGQAIVVASLIALAWRSRRATDDRSRDALIAATLAAAPLAMPYCLNYDLLTLAIPAALTARLMPTAPAAIRRRLPWLWIALAAWLYVAMPVAPRVGFNATAPLLTAAAMGLIAIACRPHAADSPLHASPAASR